MMTPQEREEVVEALASSQSRLRETVAGLTPEQWWFHESPERWSIAENVEHLLLFEGFLSDTIARTLEGPAHPKRKAHAAVKEPLVKGIAAARAEQKLQTRDVAIPTGKRTDTEAMLAELEAARAGTVNFAATTEAPLRDHFFPHLSLGALDCYQWLLLMSQHTLRHVLQIEEIKAHPAYPRASAS